MNFDKFLKALTAKNDSFLVYFDDLTGLWSATLRIDNEFLTTVKDKKAKSAVRGIIKKYKNFRQPKPEDIDFPVPVDDFLTMSDFDYALFRREAIGEDNEKIFPDEKVKELIEKLPDREKFALIARNKKLTYIEIGKLIGQSGGRIRQLEYGAFKRLKTFLKGMGSQV
jgi:DNA-directed RNA polymerase specialized sigma24 family protein